LTADLVASAASCRDLFERAWAVFGRYLIETDFDARISILFRTFVRRVHEVGGDHVVHQGPIVRNSVSAEKI
jgi:hypothetical protein